MSCYKAVVNNEEVFVRCDEWKEWAKALDEMEGEDVELYDFHFCPFCGVSLPD